MIIAVISLFVLVILVITQGPRVPQLFYGLLVASMGVGTVTCCFCEWRREKMVSR